MSERPRYWLRRDANAVVPLWGIWDEQQESWVTDLPAEILVILPDYSRYAGVPMWRNEQSPITACEYLNADPVSP